MASDCFSYFGCNQKVRQSLSGRSFLFSSALQLMQWNALKNNLLHLFNTATSTLTPSLIYVGKLDVLVNTKQVLALQPAVWGNLQPGPPSIYNDSSLHLSFSNNSKATALNTHQANQSQFICTRKRVSCSTHLQSLFK